MEINPLQEALAAIIKQPNGIHPIQCIDRHQAVRLTRILNRLGFSAARGSVLSTVVTCTTTGYAYKK